MDPNQPPKQDDAGQTNEPVVETPTADAASWEAQPEQPAPSAPAEGTSVDGMMNNNWAAPATDSTAPVAPEPALSAPVEPTVSPVQPEPVTAEASAAVQPAVSSDSQPTATAPQPASHGDNPGQVLGIVSIVLSFIGLSVVGIVLGVISRKKSAEAGAPTTLGTIGLVIGIVVTVLAILGFAALLLTGAALMSGSMAP